MDEREQEPGSPVMRRGREEASVAVDLNSIPGFSSLPDEEQLLITACRNDHATGIVYTMVKISQMRQEQKNDKAAHVALHENLEKRLGKIERWKIWCMGVGATVLALTGVIWGVLQAVASHVRP